MNWDSLGGSLASTPAVTSWAENEMQVFGIFAGSGFRFTGNVQYERWRIPLLAVTEQSNVSASFQFSFWPTPHKH